MLKKDSFIDKQNEEDISLNYQHKKLLHMIELQIMDIESTLHYIQKKHTMHQIKEALSQIYNIFNQTQPLFKFIKGMFLHDSVKKLMNCFGIIYVTMLEHIEKGEKHGTFAEFVEEKTKQSKKNENDLLQKQRSSNLKVIDTAIKDSPASKVKPLGGIYLYNQNYSRHIGNNGQNRCKRQKQQMHRKSPTKEEFNKQIIDELNDNSYNMPHPDQMLDLFTFKFKYGKENSVITFHDELKSISKFFKDAQNDAFQFLNKTKDQNAMITYNDSFSDIMSNVKKDKESRIKQFADKIHSAFRSIKRKTQGKMTEIQAKLVEMHQLKDSIKPPTTYDRQTQTSFNIDEEIKALQRKADDAEERYKIMMEHKKKEIEQNMMIGICMQNQISVKNREMVYLNLKIQQDKLIIANLNRKLKYLNDSRKMMDKGARSRKNIEPSSKTQIQNQNKNDNQSEQSLQASDQMALESIRKQKKMAKRILIQKRRGSMIEEKAVFMKRFTQIDNPKTTTNGLFGKWNLSQIAQKYHEESEINNSEHGSDSSTKNNLISRRDVLKAPTKANADKKASRHFNSTSNKSNRSSIKSIKSTLQFDRSKKSTKNISQLINALKKDSFLGKVNYSSQSIDGESNGDESDSENNRNSCDIQLSPEQIQKMEFLYKKQMSKIKNTNQRGQSKKKSIFSHQNKDYQDQCLNSQQNEIVHKSNARLSSINNATNKKISIMYKQQLNEDGSKIGEKSGSSHNLNKSRKDSVSLQASRKNIADAQSSRKVKRQNQICKCQYNMMIAPQIQKAFEEIQTDFNYNSKTQQDQDTSYSDLKTNKLSEIGKTIKDKNKIYKETQSKTQILSRSATQSKKVSITNKTMASVYISSKNRQNKQNQNQTKLKYVKNTEVTFKDCENDNKNQNQSENPKDSSIKDEATQAEAKQQKQQAQRQQKIVQQLALKCKTIQQFKNKIAKLHMRKCGLSCIHLQKFVNNFSKYRQQTKQKIRMHIQNLNEVISSNTAEVLQFPALRKKKM